MPKVKEQTDVKSSKCLKACLATRAQNPLVHGRQDEKGKLENWDWTLRRDTPWNYQDALGTKTKIRERRGQSGIIQKRWTSWAKSLRVRFEERTLEKTLTTNSLWQQSSVEFGEKNAYAEQERLKLRWNGYIEKVEKPFTVLTATGEVEINEDAQVFVHDLDLFVTVRLLAETPAVLSLSMLCSKLGVYWSGKLAKLHDWSKNGKTITTSYFLSYQDCYQIPAAVCLQHRDQRISQSSSENWEHYQIQWRLEVTSMHAGKPMLTDSDKHTTRNREPANEMKKEDPTQGILVWL